MKPTSEEVMGDLHVQVTKKLLKEIKKVKSDPRWTQMGIKMLSDNKIFMTPTVDNELGALDKHIRKRKKRFSKENITDMSEHMAKAMGDE